MTQVFSSRIRLGIALAILSAFLVSCATEASSKYWGQVEVPQDNVMHYITGGEPESLDPQFVTGQPEARMLIGLYDRLVEYHPKTMQPIPSMATNWEVSDDLVKYTFHLRQDGRFSNGDPIKADAFAWSFRRALSPELASRYAFLGYDIKYGEAYNSGKSFVKKDGKFLLEKDFQENVGDEDKDGKKDPISEEKPEELKKKQAEETAPVTDEKLKSQEKEVEKPAAENVGTTVDVEKEKSETEFEKYINSPTRLALPSDAFPLAKEVEGSRKLKDLFKYEVSDLGDAVGFAKKLSSSNDALSEFVKSKINPQAINACQNSGSCDENAKSQIVADLNKIISEEALYSPERFKPLIDAKQLSEPSVKLIENFDKENKKIADKNAEIDTQVTELTDAKEKAEKAKTKKEKITKLFYMNRFLLGEFYKNGLEKLPLEPVKAEDIGVEAIDDYTFRITLKQPAPYFTGLLTHQFFSALH
ncbi:MAG: ABC transporter substrate-binding protein, partial [Aridibacter sp.]